MDRPITDSCHYARLDFAGLCLLLPLEDVASIETAAAIAAAADTVDAVGRLDSGIPVFALDADLRLCAERPPGYRACAALGRDGRIAFALACEQAATISLPGDARIEPLRECMRPQASPIESLLLGDDRLMLVSNAGALQRYLVPERAA